MALLTVGLMARAATFQSPLFDFHSWRQADTASIARNFGEERFNPLYPQVDVRGDRAHGYVETGLELYAFLVATLARVAGFSTHLGRLLNTLLFPFAALMLYRFIKARYGQWCGLAGLYIYCLGLPLTLFMDRAFMNEALLACLTIASLRAAQCYLLAKNARYLIALLITTTLIAVVKPTYLIVWGPILGLFVEQYGARALVRWEIWLMVVTNVAASATWFLHAHSLYEMTGLTFGLSNKLFDADLLLSWRYHSKIATRLFKDLLGPVGLLFGLYGLVVAARRARWAEPLGVAAFLTYLIVITFGNFHHNYYQLPIAPIGAVLSALGLTEAVRRIGDAKQWSDDRRAYACAAILWIAAMSTFARSASFHSWYEVDQTKVRICEQLRPLLQRSQRVAFANYRSPDILFCLHRKGWLLRDDEQTTARFAALLQKGAVVVTERRYEDTVRLLDPLGTPVTSTPEFVAYGAR
ncbi:MAG: hypothetical protein GEU99_18395 [Luteitalea sp.]|nr:hypothetical protein [Luteitalea sp.]